MGLPWAIIPKKHTVSIVSMPKHLLFLLSVPLYSNMVKHLTARRRGVFGSEVGPFPIGLRKEFSRVPVVTSHVFPRNTPTNAMVVWWSCSLSVPSYPARPGFTQTKSWSINHHKSTPPKTNMAPCGQGDSVIIRNHPFSSVQFFASGGCNLGTKHLQTLTFHNISCGARKGQSGCCLVFWACVFFLCYFLGGGRRKAYQNK